MEGKNMASACPIEKGVQCFAMMKINPFAVCKFVPGKPEFFIDKGFWRRQYACQSLCYWPEDV